MGAERAINRLTRLRHREMPSQDLARETGLGAQMESRLRKMPLPVHPSPSTQPGFESKRSFDVQPMFSPFTFSSFHDCRPTFEKRWKRLRTKIRRQRRNCAKLRDYKAKGQERDNWKKGGRDNSRPERRASEVPEKIVQRKGAPIVTR